MVRFCCYFVLEGETAADIIFIVSIDSIDSIARRNMKK